MVAEGLPMEGPFPTLEEFCKSANTAADRCMIAHPECGTPSGTGNLRRAPFLEARVLGTCDVALRAPGGWYIVSTAGLPWWSAFVHNGDRYMSEITSIAPTTDRQSVLVRGTFVHGTSAAKMPWLDAPPSGDAWYAWYECEERLFVCQIGNHGPSCAGPFPVVFTAYCRDREHPERRLSRRDSHDFRFVAQVVGASLTLRSLSDKQPRRAPLPGWAVVAMTAPQTLGVMRELPPEHITLHFP